MKNKRKWSKTARIIPLLWFTSNQFIFKTKPQHKLFWHHPCSCSKKWHQLDLILSRIFSLNDIVNCANCDPDHFFLCYKLRSFTELSSLVNHRLTPTKCLYQNLYNILIMYWWQGLEVLLLKTLYHGDKINCVIPSTSQL